MLRRRVVDTCAQFSRVLSMASQQCGKSYAIQAKGTTSRWLANSDAIIRTRLVANNRKMNRKAIERVNVPRACTTIEKPPGAPIALRLQGNLLYGVSGVYLRQHTYLLDDTEKMWSAMRTFYRSIQLSASNAIDKNAGKTR